MAKRGNSEGSITQLSDGRWQARITLDNGKRKPFYAATREEVSTKLTEALSRRDKGLPVVCDEKTTLKSYLEQWLAAIKGNVRPKTWTGYEVYARLHVIPELGKVRLTSGRRPGQGTKSTPGCTSFPSWARSGW